MIFLPIGVWILCGVLVVYHLVVLHRLRALGVVPENPIEYQEAMFRGKYNHIPVLRRIRYGFFAMFVLWPLSLFVFFLFTYEPAV